MISYELLTTFDLMGATCKYRVASQVNGVGEGNAMDTQYGIVLRAEFVRAIRLAGNPSNPTEDLYFKVLPKGSADIPGVLLGWPALDAPPFEGPGSQTNNHSSTRVLPGPCLRVVMHPLSAGARTLFKRNPRGGEGVRRAGLLGQARRTDQTSAEGGGVVSYHTRI